MFGKKSDQFVLQRYLICFVFAAFFAQGFCGESQRPLSTIEKVLCAAVAGATGAFAGNPGDLAMVRMQARPSRGSQVAGGWQLMMEGDIKEVMR